MSRIEELKTFYRSYIFTALSHSPSLSLADISQAMKEISEETRGKNSDEYLAQLKAIRHFPASMLK